MNSTVWRLVGPIHAVQQEFHVVLVDVAIAIQVRIGAAGLVRDGSTRETFLQAAEVRLIDIVIPIEIRCQGPGIGEVLLTKSLM